MLIRLCKCVICNFLPLFSYVVYRWDLMFVFLLHVDKIAAFIIVIFFICFACDLPKARQKIIYSARSRVTLFVVVVDECCYLLL